MDGVLTFLLLSRDRVLTFLLLSGDRVLTYFSCFSCLLLSGVCITVYVIMWQSSDLKSNLCYEAVISTMALQSLHTGLYHGNVILWRARGIDYRKILELSPLEDIFSHVYLILASQLACFGYWLAGNIEIKGAHQGTIYLTIGFATIIGYSYYSEAWRIIFTPPKVAPANVFLGDQMCSQVPALRKVVYVFCYRFTKSHKKCDYEFYKTNTLYKISSYVISCTPFSYRGLQCWRKYCEQPSDESHLINMGKYTFAMLEAIARVGYENDKTNHVWLSFLVVFSFIATVYQLYWDFARDWDILQIKLQFRCPPEISFGWLKRELLLVPKFWYWLVVAVNVVLRFGWALQLILSRFKLNDEDITFIVSLFEVFRRGMWNFFRLENEEAKEKTRINELIIPIWFDL